jgi:ABC-type enterobactin transport system permease subunit
MLSLLGMVAAATTTALGAFSEGLVTSLVVYSVAKGSGRANLNLKK